MSTLKVDQITDSAGSLTDPPAIPALDKQLARVWLSMNRTSGVILDSYNVDSVTLLSTGYTNVVFEAGAIVDANYSAVVAGRDYSVQVNEVTNSYLQIRCRNTTEANSDPTYLSCAILTNG